MTSTPYTQLARYISVAAFSFTAMFMNAPVNAAGIYIPPGGSMLIPDGPASTTSWACSDVDVHGLLGLGNNTFELGRHITIYGTGTLNAQTSHVEHTGDWSNSGIFSAGSSSINIVDGCATTMSTMTGDSAFYDWSVTTGIGRTLKFTIGDTQDVANDLVFNGSPGNMLVIRSTSGGTPGFLELASGGTQSIDWVDVMDNWANGPPGQWIAPGKASSYNSIDAGGNQRWFGVGSFTIMVYKDFDDGNPSEVIVHKDCTSGLIPDQDQNVSEGHPIEFITTEIETRETDCEVTEDVPVGYTVTYATEEFGPTNSQGCVYEDIEDLSEFECYITNHLIPVQFDVRKLWFDEHPEFNNPMYARGRFECFNEGSLDCDFNAKGCAVFGYKRNTLWWNGADSYDSFEVLPNWNGSTYCNVWERIRDSSVESDDSDCQQVQVLLGQDALPGQGNYECTITNTRIYEGIPTLSQYGLALLALLMLGIGMVGFRRFA